MADIRASVQWKSLTVFAGEDVECTITFQNVSQARSLRHSPSSSSRLRRQDSNRERWKGTLPRRPVQGPGIPYHRAPPSVTSAAQADTTLHRPTLSLSTSYRSPDATSPTSREVVSGSPSSADNKHRRSVSIVSIGGENKGHALPPAPVVSPGQVLRGHVRAASLQVLPRKTINTNDGSQPVSGYDRAFTLPSPLIRPSSAFADRQAVSLFNVRARPCAGSESITTLSNAAKSYRNPFSNFKFPQESICPDGITGRLSSTRPEKPPDLLRKPSPRLPDSLDGFGQSSAPTKTISPALLSDTPRSSGEFYSMSNNSTETMASEYITQESNRVMRRSAHNRQSSLSAPSKASRPEVLLMGYAQITGSFILDGSLVNQSLFDGAKQRGIVGGRGGGGVVRTESTKRDSGLLGSLGWGNIGESLGGLLGSHEISSIKEAKEMSNSRSIPILSTPQAILFVDLRLGPGESKSYNFRHPLPKGIPPTHKGRVMKTSYNLIVGTQRATKLSQQHQIQQANIPFRVLPGINEQGDVLGHDLMSPHTILSNIASIYSNQSSSKAENHLRKDPFIDPPHGPSTEFISYVENLLQQPRQSSGSSLLSPTEPDSKSFAISAKVSSTMKDLVDLAILKSNVTSLSKGSANRFAIARRGRRVAMIMLARPACRLGETVPVIIDFHDSDIQCYSLHAVLETSESIDPAIALRSKASIHRVTRRVHASQFESTLAAKKVLFNPMIPLTSTPNFITSGVKLEWRLRVEFITSRIDDVDEYDDGVVGLTEEVARDERGGQKAAVQGLSCEGFDVTVPLRVYGASAGFEERTKPSELSI